MSASALGGRSIETDLYSFFSTGKMIKQQKKQNQKEEKHNPVLTRVGAHQHLIRPAFLVALYVFVNNLFARQSCTQPASPPALSWQPAHQCACISEGGVALVGALIVLVEVPQVLHRLQNKEKPMQNNFYSPVRVTQNDFRVQHCKV